MRDPQKMGRIGARTIGLYLLTTAFAISIGLLLSTLLQPGAGVDISFDGSVDANEAPTLASILINLVPRNPIDALANGNILQIIVFAIGLRFRLRWQVRKASRWSSFSTALPKRCTSLPAS